MIGLSVILFIFGALVFSFVSPIETRFLFRTIFRQVPEYFKLSGFLVQYKDYSRGMVIVSLILFTIGNGIIGPVVEELYFRGFLIPGSGRDLEKLLELKRRVKYFYNCIPTYLDTCISS